MKLQYYAARRQTSATEHPDSQQDLREIEKLLKKAVKQIPPQRRKVYQMARQEGLSHAEVADRLNISRHTVRNHVAEALQEIRTYLRNHGVMVLFLLSLMDH